jgi:hypothetical protein
MEIPSPAMERSPQGEERRRSQRVLLTIPVDVAWTTSDGEIACEPAQTEVVNMHGCLLQMETDRFVPTRKLELNNAKTQEAAIARVIRFRGAGEKRVRFAVELNAPSKILWGVTIPPRKG